jgi:hypothetical protein
MGAFIKALTLKGGSNRKQHMMLVVGELKKERML